ncbi:MAG: hypothetical protein RIB93_10345 [Coleofasciculus sp. D1-CHI-01]
MERLGDGGQFVGAGLGTKIGYSELTEKQNPPSSCARMPPAYYKKMGS